MSSSLLFFWILNVDEEKQVAIKNIKRSGKSVVIKMLRIRWSRDEVWRCT